MLEDYVHVAPGADPVLQVGAEEPDVAPDPEMCDPAGPRVLINARLPDLKEFGYHLKSGVISQVTPASVPWLSGLVKAAGSPARKRCPPNTRDPFVQVNLHSKWPVSLKRETVLIDPLQENQDGGVAQHCGCSRIALVGAQN